jgi:plasmid stabilization system protein ParE
MVFQVRLTQTAKGEIDTAYSWLKERNPVYADKWFRVLMDTIATLQSKPLRGLS